MTNSEPLRLAFRYLLCANVLLSFSAVPGAAADSGVQATLDRIQEELRAGRVTNLVIYLRAFVTGPPVAVQPNDLRANPHFLCNQTMSPARQEVLADAFRQTAFRSQDPSVSVTNVSAGIDFVNDSGSLVASIYFSHRYNTGEVFGVVNDQHVVFNDSIERWLVHTFPDQTMMRNPRGPLVVDDRCDNRLQRLFYR